MGWGPTVREIDRLAALFDEVVHVAPLHDGPAPPSELPYEAANVRLEAVKPVGGEMVAAKLGILRALPRYVSVIWRELGRSDVVHVRCPSSIGLIAICVLAVRGRPVRRWIKYAGNWRPRLPESVSYVIQRWLLTKRVPRALVTVNGEWPGEPSHVRAFLNPCLTREELRDGVAAVASKTFESPIRLLIVGRLDEEKGIGRAVRVLERLHAIGIPAILEVVGDGPGRAHFEALARETRLEAHVQFRGWLPRPALAELYRRAHFLLLPSTSSEGWPKVLSEGMAYGVVPIASDVSSIPQLLDSFEIGHALPADDIHGFASAIAGYLVDPGVWQRESARAASAANRFSYDAYLEAVRALLELRAA